MSKSKQLESEQLKEQIDTRERMQVRVVLAALKWERAYVNWSTASRDVKDTHRVTPQSEMHEAATELASAVQAYRQTLVRVRHQ